MYATTVIGILYAIYGLLVFMLMGWFIYGLTSQKKFSLKFEISITSWIIFLVIMAITFHIFTYLKLPWVKWELSSKNMIPKKEFVINVNNHKFNLPENPLKIKANEPVKFAIFSQDVTYGFGVFRKDGTMVFQIQVLPGYANEIIWIFQDPGEYTIRSTEYSGPDNWKMVVRDSIIVE